MIILIWKFMVSDFWLVACESGYWGSNCENLCQCPADKCDHVGGCISCLTAGLTGSDCSEDINECNTTTTSALCGLNGICNNTVGAYGCTCDPGYDRVLDACQSKLSFEQLPRNPIMKNRGRLSITSGHLGFLLRIENIRVSHNNATNRSL